MADHLSIKILGLLSGAAGRKIVNVTVDRATGFGAIKYEDNNLNKDSGFAAEVRAEARLPAPTKLIVHAILTRDLILAIAGDLKEMTESERRDRSAVLQKSEKSEGRIRRRTRRIVRANPRRQKK
jgi:hypothetical protein